MRVSKVNEVHLRVETEPSIARALADYFMPPTQMKYGRESTPASHWIYKVLDLNKKHTRKSFIFEDEDVTKKPLVELRAYAHYSMCSGKYPENEHVEWNEYTAIGETTYDTLYKNSNKKEFKNYLDWINRKNPKNYEYQLGHNSAPIYESFFLVFTKVVMLFIKVFILSMKVFMLFFKVFMVFMKVFMVFMKDFMLFVKVFMLFMLLMKVFQCHSQQH